MKTIFKHKALSINDSNFLKGIGILLIAFHNFFHHIAPMTGENEFDFSILRIHNLWSGITDNPLNIIDLLFSYFGHYGVQIFILISGYGLMRAYGNRKLSWRKFMTKRLNKLYPTFIFALIILAIFIKLWGHTLYPWVEYLEKITFATNFIPGKIFSLNGPWWFYGMIVELYMIFPLLVLTNKKMPKIGLFGIALLSYVIMLLWGDFFIMHEQSLHFHFLGNLPVFIFGMMIARKDNFKIHWSLIIAAVLLFAVGNLNSVMYYFSHLSIAILLLLSSLKLQNILNTNGKLSRVIYFYGEISMYLFAIHGFLRQPFIDFVNGISNPYIRPFTTLGASLLFLTFSTIMALVLKWIVNNYSKFLNYLSRILASQKIEKLFIFLKNYLVIALSFLIMIIFFRIGEYLFITHQHSFVNWSIYQLTNTVFLDLLMSAAYFGILLIPIGLISLAGNKLSNWIMSLLVIFFLIIYLGLISYFSTTLTPLDKVILAYSPSGIWSLIQSSSFSLLSFIVLIIIIIISVILLIQFFKHLKINRAKLLLFGIFVLFISSQGSKFYTDENKYLSEQNYYCNTFKPAFLLHSLSKAINESNYQNADINEVSIDYQKAHPEKAFLSTQYPLLHSRDKSSLSPYFTKSDNPVKPNVVVIICESLSNSISGKYSNYLSLTPFLDSLAGQSLYWPNTVSSAERTFGALPSVIGSLPQVNQGFLDMEKDLPYYLDLITTLNKNEYQTRFFYGGWANFNNMNTYLNESNIDKIITEFPGFNKIPENEKGFSWGYDDEAIFQGSFPYIDSLNPYLSVYLTLSTHSPFKLNNGATYESKVRKLLKNQTNERVVRECDTIVSELATFVFLDEQLKNFFENYKKRSDFKNTIFVITGDHRTMLLNPKNRLDKYHVPLLIYSPLLKKHQEFKTLVSHDDVRPSLESLLNDHFQIKTPYYSQSIGYQLDTTTTFISKGIHTLIRNSRETNEIIYKNYYLSREKLFRINDGLALEPIEDDSIKSLMKSYISNVSSMIDFIYSNNKIVPINIYNNECGAQKIAEIATDFEKEVDVYYQNQLTDSMAFSGMNSIMSNDIEYSSLFPPLALNSKYKNLILQIEFQIYISKIGKKNPLMTFAGGNPDGKTFYWEGYDFIKELGLEEGKWQKVSIKKSIFIKDKYQLGAMMKFYFWNQSISIYFIDNLSVTIKGTFGN